MLTISFQHEELVQQINSLAEMVDACRLILDVIVLMTVVMDQMSRDVVSIVWTRQIYSVLYKVLTV